MILIVYIVATVATFVLPPRTLRALQSTEWASFAPRHPRTFYFVLALIIVRLHSADDATSNLLVLFCLITNLTTALVAVPIVRTSPPTPALRLRSDLLLCHNDVRQTVGYHCLFLVAT